VCVCMCMGVGVGVGVWSRVFICVFVLTPNQHHTNTLLASCKHHAGIILTFY
jgi:hypothetical protein